MVCFWNMTDTAENTGAETVPAQAQSPATAAAEPRPKSDTKLTPMMAQYLSIKNANPDSLLFYRMGDFYELFFDDAVQAAAALDITLTKRGKHQGEDIKMCGVPVHAADSYLARLIRKGFRVAVCEQTESPAEAKKRGSKSVVARDVVRLVTPGTLTEDSLLEARSNNYLAALAGVGRMMALSWLDLSTGEFNVQMVQEGGLAASLARIAPSEFLIAQKLYDQDNIQAALTDWLDDAIAQPDSLFDSINAERRLKDHFSVSSLDAFGDFQRAELAAAGALLDYIHLTQVGKAPRLNPPRQVSSGSILEIDQATRRNLELTRTLSGEYRGCLLDVIDRTVTGGGARVLAARLAAPLADLTGINNRLNAVTLFHDNAMLRHDLRDVLRGSPDIQRALSRLTVGRGGPRDLAAIRDGLSLTNRIRALLSHASDTLPDLLAKASDDLGLHDMMVDELEQALSDDMPLNARDGGFIQTGYSPALDHQKNLRDEGRRLIAGLEGQYRQETGVDTLKIKHNNVLGYFIEVTAKNADAMGDVFIHRQSVSNAVRYSTVALADLARDISEAGDKALAMEQELFDSLVAKVTEQSGAIALNAAALAEFDWATALAELAIEQRFVRPQLTDDLSFEIEQGRHAVVETALAKSGEGSFVANDCNLGRDQHLWLVTGPNMAGKSTFLRQNALIVVLAQSGCFVPAENARLGLVDRLFSRVGASDDLARGRSTFMVEMVETATILNQATERSLVILDEIGRGTATFDGLSIAWACVEHLHEVTKARALFATHYHELTALTQRLSALAPHCMLVKEWQGDVVFLHEVGAGAADRSYGIHVARLAGLPSPVIARAEDVLHTLERGEQSGAVTRLIDDLPLFQAAASAPPVAAKGVSVSEVEETLETINPDDLTPREALEALYSLKALLSKA